MLRSFENSCILLRVKREIKIIILRVMEELKKAMFRQRRKRK